MTSKKKGRLLAGLLFALMLAGLLPAAAFAEGEEANTIQVVKNWGGDENYMDKRPESITVRLLNTEGAEVSSTELTAAGNWTGSLNAGTPDYSGYTIAEVSVPEGYSSVVTQQPAPAVEASVSVGSFGEKVTPANNSSYPLNGSLIVAKKGSTYDVWTASPLDATSLELLIKAINEANPEGLGKDLSTDNVDYKYGDAVFTGSNPEETVTIGNGTITFGKTSAWSLFYADYCELIPGRPAQGAVITNTYTPPQPPETIDISVTKVWDDNDNEAGLRPDSVTVNLLKNGVELQEVRLNEANSWAHTFTDLPKTDEAGDGTVTENVYTVNEDDVIDYTAAIVSTDNGFTITNTYTPTYKPPQPPEPISISVTKSWNDNDNEAGLRPDSVTVNLLADGEDTGKFLTLSEENNWTGSFTDLPKTVVGADGEPRDIVYTVTEDPVTNYTAAIESTDNGFTITNTYTPTPPPETTDISVTKVWVGDDNNANNTRPANGIVVVLYADGVENQRRTLTAPDWAYTFEDLPAKGTDGSPICYTVEEVTVPGYSTAYSNLTGNGYTITNTYDPVETIDISATKVWDDCNDIEGFRPDSVTVRLLVDGKDTGKFLTLSEENEWTGSFTGLPQSVDGKDVKYSITEDSVAHYTPIITSGVDSPNDYVVTNKHVVSYIDIPVRKFWNDDNNVNNRRPSSIIVYLYANGEPTDRSLVISAREGWVDSFSGLPVYRNGQAIEYSVREKSMYFYDGKVSVDDNGGFVVVNTYTTTPRTGDTSNIGLWIAIAGVSLAAVGAAAVVIWKKSRRK